MPKRSLFFIILIVVVLSSSYAALSDWIDDYLGLHVTVDCTAHAGMGEYYASEVGNEELYNWFKYEVESSSRGCDVTKRKKMTFNGTISYQDACSLLQADPVEAIIIHNSLIEIKKDPKFEGVVCSLSGLLNPIFS